MPEKRAAELVQFYKEAHKTHHVPLIKNSSVRMEVAFVSAAERVIAFRREWMDLQALERDGNE